jgi:hypothetical protein
MADDLPDDEIPPGEGEVPAAERKSSKRWLQLITDADKDFARDFDERSTGIEKAYADMERLNNAVRDRQFALFWANVQVLGPSIYSRTPVPVVQMRFKRKNPTGRAAAEMLEACAVTAFEQGKINGTMKLIRDDLTTTARGVAWVRYESDGKKGDRVCFDWLHRKDFRHEMARAWKEVGWVARAGYLTKPQLRKRFKVAKEDLGDISFQVRKEDKDGDLSMKRTAKVWEIWHKEENKTVWVTEGFDKVLEEGEPPLNLEDFFPCPEPAFGTTQRGTLKPISDFMFYKDQIEEVNQLTARIHSLSESLRLKGFYASGQGEIGDAVEKAIASVEDRIVLIPIKNWALTGSGSAKDAILWLPIREVAETITALVALRKQVIDDVYQITGISDIMRGSTEASETLGAQQLKSQYGSVRVRDRQEELVRVALELTRISCEIMAEEFSKDSLVKMSQMDDLLRKDSEVRADIRRLEEQRRVIDKQIDDAMKDPEIQQQMQADPEAAAKAQQALQQAQQQLIGIGRQIDKLEEEPTVEKVVKYLKDEKVRPFSLEIETDSTIQPDENMAKQRATEFVTAVGGFIGAAIPQVQMMPELAPLAAEMLKYAANQFRADRQLITKVEEFADQILEKASQPQPPSPEAQKAAAEAQAMQQKAQADAAEREQRMQLAAQDDERKERLAKLEMDQKTALSDQQANLNKALFDERVRDLGVAAMQREAQHRIDMDIKAADRDIRQLDVQKAEKQIDQIDLTNQGKVIDNSRAAAEPLNGSKS